MQTKENKSRREFLKKIPFALGSFVIFSGFSSKKTNSVSQEKFNTLSKTETNEIIKNSNFPVLMHLEPSPAPYK